jgi:hypothetical protein
VPHGPARTAALLPLAALVALVPPLPASGVDVRTALATEKVMPGEALRSTTDVHVFAARNEFESFQVVVRGAAANVRASASPLTGPATLPAPRLFRVELMNLANASGPDGGTGRWPDALVPDVDETAHEARNAFPFQVAAGDSRAIWADAFVPEGTPAGDYAGSVTVTWDGGSASVPVTLTVWPFTLPQRASLKSAFGFYYGAIPGAHGTLSPDAFAKLRERYGRLALEHRFTLSHFDDGGDVLAHLGDPQYYAPLVGGTAATSVAGAALTSVECAAPRDSASAIATWTQAARAGGWFDRIFQYTCDEPGGQYCTWDRLRTNASAARAADPELRTLVTTAIQLADANGVTSLIDVMVPVINWLDDKASGGRYPGNQRSKYDAFLAGSPQRELWTYQSCMSHGCGATTDPYWTGWPSYMIDATAVRNRAMQWLAFKYRVSGELYWETANAFGKMDPWATQWAYSGNGDGTLFYPGTPAKIGGTTHVPVASIRMKMIREGMEDFEYLKILSDAGQDALAHEIVDGLFPNGYSTQQEPSALMAARTRAAEAIVAAGAGGGGGDGGGGGGTPGGGGTGGGGGQPPTAPGSPLVRGGCAAGGAAGLAALAGLAGALRIRRRR